jgi:phosphatidylserine/phosphatidylglycerophosphate/cardiolipin synthase-like enzyme
MRSKYIPIGLGIILISLGTLAFLYDLSIDPLPLFTDNLSASAPSNQVTVMEQALLDRINTADHSIDLSIYGFNRVSIRQALINALNRGVEIRVVADDEAMNDPDYTTSFSLLQAAGIPIVNDSRASIMHNKFILIDGQIVWTGSTNITDTGFTLNHNNTLVFTSTQLADIYTLEFEEMYLDHLFGTHKKDNTTHTITYRGAPLEIYFSPSDGALDEIISEVETASQDIYFSIFVFTDPRLRNAVLDRKRAGVTITGLWDKLGAANPSSVDEALCAAGIPIKIEDFEGKLHNKFMLIDVTSSSPRLVTGSMNWSTSGTDANDENTIIYHDSSTIQAYLTNFQTLYNALGPETLCLESAKHFIPLVIRP